MLGGCDLKIARLPDVVYTSSTPKWMFDPLRFKESPPRRTLENRRRSTLHNRPTKLAQDKTIYTAPWPVQANNFFGSQPDQYTG